MSGLVRGFQAGFGMADQIAQQQENKRRYGIQQDRLDRAEEREIERYGVQQDRLNRQEKRQQTLHDNQVETYEYQKGQRPILEKRAEETHKANMKTTKLNQSLLSQNIKSAEYTYNMKHVEDALGMLRKSTEDGKLPPPEVMQYYVEQTAGTAFDPVLLNDGDYISSLDTLTAASQYGIQTIPPEQLFKAFNKIFQNEISDVQVAQGSAYNRITDVEFDKEGNAILEVTAFDQMGRPVGQKKLDDKVKYGDMIDNVMARKTIAASFMANPTVMAGMKYGAEKFGAGQGNIDYATKNKATFLKDMYKDLTNNYASAHEKLLEAKSDPSAVNTADIDAEIKALNETYRNDLNALIRGYPPHVVELSGIPVGGLSNQDPSPQKTEQQQAENLAAYKALLRKFGINPETGTKEKKPSTVSAKEALKQVQALGVGSF